ncbi:HAD-IIIA family hydrolase [Gammaproteobacteria bacterium LSUCC0112]|nr:HAD-IIIA family hydrolase [Gammaproteobacteria bacterium LSUCC0112]
MTPTLEAFEPLRFYQDAESVRQSAANVRLLVLDVDGVLTDGQLYFSDQGEFLKAFNTLDGQGIKSLQKQGIQVAIISGRQSGALTNRARALGITLMAQGREDKMAALNELLAAQSVQLNEIAYMGDDLPDLLVMRHIGLPVAVPDAHYEVHRVAHACTTRRGGHGAVRDVCDFLLLSQQRYQAAISAYTEDGRLA